MELILTVGISVGAVLLVFFAVDRQICVSGLKEDLSTYLADARQVVRIADDPRVVIHYKAVVSALSAIYSKYFYVEQGTNG